MTSMQNRAGKDEEVPLDSKKKAFQSAGQYVFKNIKDKLAYHFQGVVWSYRIEA